MLVGCRAPNAIISDVDDADQLVAAPRQQSLQPAAKVGRLDLPRVGRTDRGESAGADETALEKVDFAVKLQPLHVKQPLRQAEQRQVEVPEQALVSKVVYREHGTDAFVLAAQLAARMPRVELAEIDRSQARLPVVEAQHVGPRAQARQRLQHGPAEE